MAGFEPRLIPDGLHPAIKPPGKRRAIGVGPEVGMGVAPSVGPLGPDVVKAPRCEQCTEVEDALATALAPRADDQGVCHCRAWTLSMSTLALAKEMSECQWVIRVFRLISFQLWRE